MGFYVYQHSTYGSAGVAVSVHVRYSDIAVGAKSAFDYKIDGASIVYNPDLMKEENGVFKRYDLPLEINSFILDGGAEFLPETGDVQAGLISEFTSGENGEFKDNVPHIILSSTDLFSSIGLTIRFDEVKNIYATDMHIDWYRDDELVASGDFYPDSPIYFCSKKIEYFNRLDVSVSSINLPHTKFRLNSIDFGLIVDFGGDELRSAKIIQEIDPISTSLPANPFDFTIDSRRGLEFSFQERQPIKVFFNNELLSTSFVRTAKRISKNMWSIKSEDYIWVMDTVSFKGGLYTDKNAVELLQEIFNTAKVPYDIDSVFDSSTVSGYIPYTSCREALMQVLFAIQAVADTSNSELVKVFSLPEKALQELPRERVMQGQNFQNETRVTAVEVVSHTYVPSQETTVAYSAEESGIGDEIFVAFSDPLYDLSITRGTIIEYGANYAIINANEWCKLSGKTYNHTKTVKTKKNPLVLSHDTENIVRVEKGTLVSDKNVDIILEKCYNYFVNTDQTNMKIIDGAGNGIGLNYYGSNLYGETTYGTMAVRPVTTVGDLIKYETEYLGNKTGRIIKQSYSLVGNIIVKDSVLR